MIYNLYTFAFVFALTYALMMVFFLQMLVRDVWKERWNGQPSPMEKYDSDLEAFAYNFVDDSAPHVSYVRLFGYPIVLALAVATVWWLLTAVTAWVVL